MKKTPFRSFGKKLAGCTFLGVFLLAPVHAQDESEPIVSKTPSGKPELSLDATSFNSPDGEGWALGIKWDVKLDHRWDWAYLGLTSSGAWAIDKEELNQTPILAQARAGGYVTIMKPEPISAPSLGGTMVSAGELKPGAQLQSEIGLLWGLNGRYETDQGGDYSNGVFAGFVGVGNTNSRNIWALLPSLYLSVDGVVPDSNKSVEMMGGADEAYGRFYVAADWLVGLDVRAAHTFLDPFSFHVALEFSKSFNTPVAIAATGQGENFGALFELLYKIDTGFRKNNEHTLPMWLFAQYTAGKFTPLPESENRLMAGLRWKF